MSGYRITSSGPTHLLGGAMIPVPAMGASAFQSRGAGVTWYGPNNVIPAPRPAGVPQDRSGMRGMGGDSRSSDSPNWWTPNIYYMRELASPPNVSVYSDNQLPVPAIDPRGLPSVTMARPRLGGQFQQQTPKVVQFFKNMGGASG